jgi:phage-related holin
MMDWLYDNFYNTLCAIFFAVIGYFTEIQGAVHVMWAALAFDLISGILASMIRRKEKFSMGKAFTGIGRAIGCTCLVALLYAMDKEMHQSVAASYNIAAWLISGFYAWSASENMDDLFGGKIFGILKTFFAKRVQETSGIDLNEQTKELSKQ